MPYLKIDKAELGVYTISDLADRLGIRRTVLQGRINRGKFPGPTHTVYGLRRFYYTEQEVQDFLKANNEEVE